MFQTLPWSVVADTGCILSDGEGEGIGEGEEDAAEEKGDKYNLLICVDNSESLAYP